MSHGLCIKSGEKLDLAAVSAARTELQQQLLRVVVNSQPFDSVKWRRIGIIFGWNARNMKRHFGRMLTWSLDNLLENNTFRTKVSEPPGGISPYSIWGEILFNLGRQDSMPPFKVIEELYLDSTLQLHPRMYSSSSELTEYLKRDDLEAAIRMLEYVDHDENTGFIDCIFNYLTKDVLVSGGSVCNSAALIMLRIAQYVEINRDARFAEICEFLDAIGYSKVPLASKQMFVYVMARNEMISFHGSDQMRTIDDALFNITAAGMLVIRKIVYSVTYLSEGMAITELPSDGLSTCLIKRVFTDRGRWAFNAAINAIIAFNIIKEIELCEQKNARINDVEYSEYIIVEKMRKVLGKEVERIYRYEARLRKLHLRDAEYVFQACNRNMLRRKAEIEFERIINVDSI